MRKTPNRSRLPQHLLAPLLLLLLLAALPATLTANMKIHLIDVGQGHASLVEFPCGSLLIDTGGEKTRRWRSGANEDGAKKLSAYLLDFFDTRPHLGSRLDLLLLTHPHLDHTRSVKHVISQYRPHNLVDNGQTTGSGKAGQKALQRYASDTGTPYWYVKTTTFTSAGFTNRVIDPIDCSASGSEDPKISVLWGQTTDPGDWGSNHFDDENNHSIVLRVEWGNASVLFLGDLEEPAIEDLLEKYKTSPELLKADALQVSHHGSANGTTADLVAAVAPHVALIGAGQPCKRKGYSAWTHGHPRTGVIDDLVASTTSARATTSVRVADGVRTFRPYSLDKAIYSTGWDGHVVVELDSSGTLVSVSTDPQPQLCD